MWLPLWRRKHKPGPLKSSADFRAGQVGGKLGHVGLFAAGEAAAYAASISTNSLACLCRYRIAGSVAVFDVKLTGFTYVAQRFRAVVPLADRSWQCRDFGDMTAIPFLLQDDRATHRGSH